MTLSNLSISTRYRASPSPNFPYLFASETMYPKKELGLPEVESEEERFKRIHVKQ